LFQHTYANENLLGWTCFTWNLVGKDLNQLTPGIEHFLKLTLLKL
jgi:hypothetical protein